jgi:hypothetical protein
MRGLSVALACVLSAALGGCAIFADPNAWPQKFPYADSENIAASGNVRFVNDRPRYVPGRGIVMTMCNEPMPDVAVTFATSLAASANITGQGSGSGSASTSEQALALAGRTASVLALRDGLYATCQAYTNGALGQSAYALGLSQYGNLLVSLTAGVPGDPGGQTTPKAAPAPAAPGADQGAAPPADPAAAASPADPAAAAPKKKGAVLDSATRHRASVGHPVTKDKTSALDYAQTHYASLDPAIYATDAVAPAEIAHAHIAQAGDGAHTPTPTPTPKPAPAPTAKTTNKTPAAAASNPQAYTASESAAVALMVACISEYDPTRLGAVQPDGRPWTNQVLTPQFCSKYIYGLANKLTRAPMR